MKSKNSKISNATWPKEYSSPSMYRSPLLLEIRQHKFDNYIKYTFPDVSSANTIQRKDIKWWRSLGTELIPKHLTAMDPHVGKDYFDRVTPRDDNGHLVQHPIFQNITRTDSRLPIFTTKNVNFRGWPGGSGS